MIWQHISFCTIYCFWGEILSLGEGLMLRINDEKKDVRAIEKGACRGISIHLKWGLLLHLSWIHVVGQVCE
jgi:hypothetical protein